MLRAMSKQLQRAKVTGFDVAYAVIDPLVDDAYAAHQNGLTVKEMGQREVADIALNFNYANTTTGVPIGRVIVGGKIVNGDIPKTVARDELYMLPDKTVHIGKAPAGAVWALQGSPPLLNGGKNVVAEGIARDQLGTDIWRGANLRTAVGVTASGKLVIVRTYDKLTLGELAALMAKLGSIDALNADGGGSCYVWPQETGWGRKLGAALIVKQGEIKTMDKLTIKQDIIPVGRKNRPGYALKAEYITIHGTGNTASTADAANHALYLKGDAAAASPVSWHFTVDDKQIIQHLPITESGWHAGDGTNGPGNRKTIGIELCENAGVNRNLVEANAAMLVAYLLDATDLQVTAVVQHNKWSGKNCPQLFRSRSGSWEAFLVAIEKEQKKNDPLPNEDKSLGTGTFKDVPDNHWAVKSIEKAAKANVIAGVAPSILGLGQPVTIERLAVILDRLGLLD
ncbi:N-acetylmuramoyl-L-alanine amidase [Paenibacillus sp. 2TAB19]|uniref:N-acetylmuramoyl-L-alanine amidase n=1 Tax=Paenibacillus sp. 2TAB19 TaxID=3233003 RepID=UPI003F9DF97B